jgi:hypothetical protein
VVGLVGVDQRWIHERIHILKKPFIERVRDLLDMNNARCNDAHPSCSDVLLTRLALLNCVAVSKSVSVCEGFEGIAEVLFDHLVVKH